MLKSIVVLDVPITLSLATQRRTDMLLTEEDMMNIKALIQVLDPFEELTTELSSQDYPSLSKVIPSVSLLNEHLEGLEDLPPSVVLLVFDLQYVSSLYSSLLFKIF